MTCQGKNKNLNQAQKIEKVDKEKENIQNSKRKIIRSGNKENGK